MIPTLGLPGNPFWFAVGSLASWRIARLLFMEDGPWGLFIVIRRGLYRLRLDKLVECFHCLSLWVSVGVALLTFQTGWNVILLGLGMAGAASVLFQVTERHAASEHTGEN